MQNILCVDMGVLRGYYRAPRLIERANGYQEITTTFNIGKQAEFKQRVFFKTQKSLETHKDK